MRKKPEWANPKWGSWADYPEEIPAEKIRECDRNDVLIIGAGLAGMCAALRAAQNGATVLVIERGKKWSARGGNIGVPESSFLDSQRIKIDKEAFVREWIKRCGNRCVEKVVWLFVNNCKEAMDWLFDIVTKDGLTRPIVQGANYRGETYYEFSGSHRFMDGPWAKKGARPGVTDVVSALYDEAVKLGVKFVFKTRGEQLIKRDGRVVGIIASDDQGYCAYYGEKGVVLATGDISGNEEMCEDLSPSANRCAFKVYTPKGQNTGDGHRMGLWAGGIMEDTPFAGMIHPQSFTTRNYCFLFINQKGERFMNEDNYIQGKCLGILRQNRTYAWSIIDSAWEEKVPKTLPYGGGIFWDQDRDINEEWDVSIDRGCLDRSRKASHLLEAETIEELAEKMGVPAENLKKTFERYNEVVAQGKDIDFGKRKELLIPLDKPPYIAMKFGATMLVVVGGLRIDDRLRVIDKKLDHVPGLYAIGNVCGGRYGTDYPMLTPGNSHGSAMTFGYLAGEFITGKK